MDKARDQREFEQHFLTQLTGRAQALVRVGLPVDRVTVDETPDGADAARQTLANLGRYDQRLLNALPSRRGVLLRFARQRVLGLVHETVVRLRARVLADLPALATGREPQPVDREQVLDALSEFERLPKNQRSSCAVLASPTGFTAEARELVAASRAPALVLLGGRDDGGWDVNVPAAIEKTTWAKLFELESASQKLQRVARYLNERTGQLETSGVALKTLAGDLSLPVLEAEKLVRQACRQDPRLMTVPTAESIRVCRSPLAGEAPAMSWWQRIRRLFGAQPTPAERVRELTAQRVLLEQQRGELDAQVDALEGQERDLLKQGADAPSQAEKKQVAGKLIRVRKDLRRYRTRVQMFNQQIDVLGTQVHHLTLKQQSTQVPMPTAEELTQQAAEAEQMINELATNADLANSIEAGATTPQTEADEAAILAEFDAYEAQTPAAEPSEARNTPPESAATEESPTGVDEPEPRERPRPELG